MSDSASAASTVESTTCPMCLEDVTVERSNGEPLYLVARRADGSSDRPCLVPLAETCMRTPHVVCGECVDQWVAHPLLQQPHLPTPPRCCAQCRSPFTSLATLPRSPAEALLRVTAPGVRFWEEVLLPDPVIKYTYEGADEDEGEGEEDDDGITLIENVDDDGLPVPFDEELAYVYAEASTEAEVQMALGSDQDRSYECEDEGDGEMMQVDGVDEVDDGTRSGDDEDDGDVVGGEAAADSVVMAAVGISTGGAGAGTCAANAIIVEDDDDDDEVGGSWFEHQQQQQQWPQYDVIDLTSEPSSLAPPIGSSHAVLTSPMR